MNDSNHSDESPRWKSDPDPVWINSRCEAWWIFGLWVGCLIWTIGACRMLAYRTDVPPTHFGIPDWVWIGVVLPWVVAGIASFVFSYGILRDEPLE